VVLADEPVLRMIRRTTIHETEVGLLYRKGRFDRLVEAGRHWFVGAHVRVTRVDARRRLLTVGSQEVLSSDSVQLRLSVIVAFRVSDPARALHEFENYEHELHLATQLALRSAVGERSVDELLEGRLDLAERLRELVGAMAPDLGLAIESVQLRDVMLPGNLKTAYAEVLQARAEGRAALERARGESAALRSLANAARVMDSTPGLMNLRLLQTMEQDAGGPAATTRFVVHMPGASPTSAHAEKHDDGGT
jgi:regulator of protease activity HflC (stomatin/prohibitin superfamily)